MRKATHFLTADDVRAIRLAGEWGWSAVLVAEIFGLDYSWCRRVMRGETHAVVQ